MNINNGKTGNVNIPGALHSTGGDGDGQVGGVVAYAGDVYDETLGKNQKEINQTLLNGSADSNVIAVALNDLNEKVEEQEKVTSSSLNDLNNKIDNLDNNESVIASSLNDKVDNLNDKVDDNEKTIASALTDLDEKTDTNEKAVSAALNDLNNKISDLPLTPIKGYTGSFKNIPKEDSNVIEADETIALGVGVYGDKQRSFGWGSGYQTLWLTGSNSQYTVRMGNPSAVSEDKQPLEALATAWIGGYILTSGTTHTRVTKITAANFTNGVLTITTDTNLGTLNDTKYTYESKTGQQNFCAGSFINSGRQNIAIGTSNFVTSSFSIIIGTMNGSTTNAKWSTTIGEWNNNDGNGGTIVGLDNTVKTSAGTILGTHNSIITSNSNVPSSILGYRNNISSGYGILIGNDNISSGNFSCIFGYDNFANTTSTAFLIGQKLICENSRGGYYIGQYNKEYISNNTSVANWFAVGCGNNDSSRQNVIEVKQNGDTYIYGVGGFTGANSDSSSIKSLQTVISDIQTSLSSSSSSSSPITESNGSYVLGNTSSALGGSFAEGYQTRAYANYSHTEGMNTSTNNGMASHAEGNSTKCNSGSNHAEGYITKSYGTASHSEGYKTTALNDYSHAEGNNTVAIAEAAHSEGTQTIAYGKASHAEGYGGNNLEYIDTNVIEVSEGPGGLCQLKTSTPVQVGDILMINWEINPNNTTLRLKVLEVLELTSDYTLVKVDAPVSQISDIPADYESYNVLSSCKAAYGEYSHIEGYKTTALGNYSHAEGEGTETTNTAEHASGKYNYSTSGKTQFSVGIGSQDSNRKNAFEVDVNGNVYIKGIGTYDGTNIGANGVKSVQQVIADLTLQIAALSNN